MMERVPFEREMAPSAFQVTERSPTEACDGCRRTATRRAFLEVARLGKSRRSLVRRRNLFQRLTN